MIAIIDYGAGNLFSVQNALNFLGLPNTITRDADTLKKADGLILPGVGAFPDAMRMLKGSGLVDVIREEAVKKPFLGICLGMQLLFTDGYEFEHTDGLDLIPGSVERIRCPYKIPHMGWNHLKLNGTSPLLAGVPEGSSVYFVHSYMANTAPENVTAYCEYGVDIPALAERGTVFGAQFHPEKSGEVGLTILRNFGGLTR
jgi:glutamine amidotransferase